jgi:hypothetical protein
MNETNRSAQLAALLSVLSKQVSAHPLPHENREWGAGALATRDATLGASAQSLVHQLMGLVRSPVNLNRVFSSTGDEMTLHRVYIDECCFIWGNLIFRYI